LKNSRRGSQSGFSLIELAIAMVVLGVVVAVAVPLYTGHVKSGRTSAAVARLTTIMDASKDYYQRYGVWPSAPGQAGYSADFSNSEYFAFRINTGGGGTGKFHLRAKGRNKDGMTEVEVFMRCTKSSTQPTIDIKGL